jgi:serine/threonine protein phosphatase PrpC
MLNQNFVEILSFTLNLDTFQDDTAASFYAVYDGHAGSDAAVFSASHVHQFLAESQFYPSDPASAIKDAILRTDNMYLKKVEAEVGSVN